MSCYVCLDEETQRNPFCDIRICNCKGTNRIHKTCYSNIRFNGIHSCSICKSIFRQNVKKTLINSDDYKKVSTKIYNNDEIEYINTRVSSLICCSII